MNYWTEEQIRAVWEEHYPNVFEGELGPDYDCAGCPAWTTFGVDHIIDELRKTV